MDDPKVINKLVYDHLQENVSKKLADEFLQSVGKKIIQKKLDGIPSITHMVTQLIKTDSLPTNGEAVNGKRKVSEVNGHGPKAKKQKQDSDSDDSDESDEEEYEAALKVV